MTLTKKVTIEKNNPDCFGRSDSVSNVRHCETIFFQFFCDLEKISCVGCHGSIISLGVCCKSSSLFRGTIIPSRLFLLIMNSEDCIFVAKEWEKWKNISNSKKRNKGDKTTKKHLTYTSEPIVNIVVGQVRKNRFIFPGYGFISMKCLFKVSYFIPCCTEPINYSHYPFK